MSEGVVKADGDTAGILRSFLVFSQDKVLARNMKHIWDGVAPFIHHLKSYSNQ